MLSKSGPGGGVGHRGDGWKEFKYLLSKSGPGGGVGQKGDGWKEIKYLLSKRGKNILEVKILY